MVDNHNHSQGQENEEVVSPSIMAVLELRAEYKAFIANLTEGLTAPETTNASRSIYRRSIDHYKAKIETLDEILYRASHPVNPKEVTDDTDAPNDTQD